MVCAEMLFKFQCQIEKLWQELSFSPGVFSVSPLRLDMIRYNQIWCTKVENPKIENPSDWQIDKSGSDLNQIYKRPTNWN